MRNSQLLLLLGKLDRRERQKSATTTAPQILKWSRKCANVIPFRVSSEVGESVCPPVCVCVWCVVIICCDDKRFFHNFGYSGCLFAHTKCTPHIDRISKSIPLKFLLKSFSNLKNMIRRWESGISVDNRRGISGSPMCFVPIENWKRKKKTFLIITFCGCLIGLFESSIPTTNECCVYDSYDSFHNHLLLWSTLCTAHKMHDSHPQCTVQASLASTRKRKKKKNEMSESLYLYGCNAYISACVRATCVCECVFVCICSGRSGIVVRVRLVEYWMRLGVRLRYS